ncbi:hypothetical protein FNF31_05699 [Cafeteria roenbergensis]|uniref:Cation-transporting P-type ATPase N-terminal domain-containing protein n=1 Tax=Cafeteria roenbergensis TaxID=33653 RepID=A0A5A8CXW8_CAFRO|nr:hypothetical protein FNF31_05699 [Cafeteria roenbergensis]KAA0164679.1 hypothetical protein FNF28_03740 [Cafeteria roenbergensis]
MLERFDALEVTECATRLKTLVNAAAVSRSEGLTPAEAASRLAEHGPNALPAPKERPEIVKFLCKILDPFLAMLLGAAILSLIPWMAGVGTNVIDLYLAGVLGLVVIINAAIDYAQEASSSALMRKLADMLPRGALVRRNGESVTVPAPELVPGDIVLLATGDTVPADVRVIESTGLQIEAASITGESAPYEASTDACDVADITDARNVAFSSSHVVDGRGVGLVTATGPDTLIGRLAVLSAGPRPTSTLNKETNRFVKVIAVTAIVLAVTFFIVGLVQGREPFNLFITACITLIVASVPQGLPATVTSALSVAAGRMKRANVLVKRLDAVETLGAVTVVCSDKTGTLTTNNMTVRSIFFAGQPVAGGTRLFADKPKTERVQGVDVPVPVWRPEVGNCLGADSAAAADAKPASEDSDSAADGAAPAAAPAEDEGGAAARPATDALRRTMLAPLRVPEAAAGQLRASAMEISRSASGSVRRAHTLHAVRDWYAAVCEPALLVALVCNAASAERAMPVSALTDRTDAATLKRASSMPREVASPRAASDEEADDGKVWRAVSAMPTHKAKVDDITVSVAPQERTNVAPPAANGNASDVALLRFCSTLADAQAVRDTFATMAEVPFSSARKWAAVVVAAPEWERASMNSSADPDPRPIVHVLVKGAPEKVQDMCDTQLDRNADGALVSREMDGLHKAHAARAYKAYAAEGQRVLGLAMASCRVPSDATSQQVQALVNAAVAAPGGLSGLTFLGLVSLVDPPKASTAGTIAAARSAGVRVFMVTGDHALTAGAIGREIGLIRGETRADVALARGAAVTDIPWSNEEVTSAVVRGSELDHFSDEDWTAVLQKPEVVFARTTPEHKAEIARRLRDLQNIVAMTGDGTNDAPAMRAADIGVAMGRPDASDVAREAADVVLLDDNLASVVAGVAEGRVLFANLRKTIAYTLGHLLPEIAAVVLNLTAGLPLGLAPLQVLSVDLGTELLPAMSFAFEAPEDAVMEVPPRGPDDHLIDTGIMAYSYAFVGLLESLACIGAYAWVFADAGLSLGSIVGKSEFYFEPGAPILYTDAGVPLSGEEQQDILWRARAAWHLNLIVAQLFHLIACKTTVSSALRAAVDLSKFNLVAAAGGLLAVALVVVFVYVPEMQPIMTTRGVPLLMITPALAAGVLILGLSELYKWRLASRVRTAKED